MGDSVNLFYSLSQTKFKMRIRRYYKIYMTPLIATMRNECIIYIKIKIIIYSIKNARS